MLRHEGGGGKPAALAAAARASESAALVIFADDSGSVRWLRLLRRGFRHCFVAVANDDQWVICDPLSNQTDLNVVFNLTVGELAEWFRSHGLLVVETYVRAAPGRPAPIRPFTCVEAVKRILGIHAPRVLTPWQLYRLLTRKDESLDMIT